MANPIKAAASSQSDKFKEAARELGADESEDAFKKVVRQIGAARPDKPAPEPKQKKRGRSA